MFIASNPTASVGAPSGHSVTRLANPNGRGAEPAFSSADRLPRHDECSAPRSAVTQRETALD